MSEQLLACPHCYGKGGHVVPFTGGETVDCDLCVATGKIEKAHYERWLRGREMRRQRLERGISQREAAEALGVSLEDLSRIERGVIEMPA